MKDTCYTRHVLLPIGVVLSFVETQFTAEETDDEIQICVEVCDGLLKRNVPFYVKLFNGSYGLNVAQCRFSL